MVDDSRWLITQHPPFYTSFNNHFDTDISKYVLFQLQLMLLWNVITVSEHAVSWFVDFHSGGKHDLGFRLFKDNTVCYGAGERPLPPLQSERVLVVMADRFPSPDCEEKHMRLQNIITLIMVHGLCQKFCSWCSKKGCGHRIMNECWQGCCRISCYYIIALHICLIKSVFNAKRWCFAKDAATWCLHICRCSDWHYKGISC